MLPTHGVASHPRAHRRACNDALERAVRQARRYGTPSSVALMDVDHFKNLNDAFGHVAGDEALRGFAARAAHALRRSDALFRTGVRRSPLRFPTQPLARSSKLCASISCVPDGYCCVSCGAGLWLHVDGVEEIEGLLLMVGVGGHGEGGASGGVRAGSFASVRSLTEASQSMVR